MRGRSLDSVVAGSGAVLVASSGRGPGGKGLSDGQPAGRAGGAELRWSAWAPPTNSPRPSPSWPARPAGSTARFPTPTAASPGLGPDSPPVRTRRSNQHEHHRRHRRLERLRRDDRPRACRRQPHRLGGIQQHPQRAPRPTWARTSQPRRPRTPSRSAMPPRWPGSGSTPRSSSGRANVPGKHRPRRRPR